jgi:hypothetical protein
MAMDFTSQIDSIMRQVFHIAAPQVWQSYIVILSSILPNTNPHPYLVATSLESVESLLRPYPLLTLFHDMLLEELTDLPRTLSPGLAALYPWHDMLLHVVEAYIAFALERERRMGEENDVQLAWDELGQFLELVTLVRGVEPVEEEVLADGMGRMRIEEWLEC